MGDLAGKKILVAGGDGFLGAHVCKALQQAGAEVTSLDIKPLHRCRNLARLAPGVKTVTGSVTDENLVDQAVRGMNAVVDASFPLAQCDPGPGEQYIAVGTVGLYNLLKAAWRERAQFVFASSISVYGIQQYTPVDEGHPLKPVLLYGVTKLAGEHYCRVMCERYGCSVVVLRFSDIYGPGEGRHGAPVNFLYRALRGEVLLVRGDGRQVRSYIYASDAADAVVCALKHFKPGAVYNIAGTEPVSILELARLARKISGVAVPVDLVPGSDPDPRNYVIDGTLAAREIKFRPRIDMYRGLAHTLKWLKEGCG